MGIPILQHTATVLDLAKDFLIERLVPERVKSDALHVAMAAVHGMDYLLTCR